MNKRIITVLKTTFNKDLVDRYVEREWRKMLKPCEVFREGQVFITDVREQGYLCRCRIF
jgi:hypothetical protein